MDPLAAFADRLVGQPYDIEFRQARSDLALHLDCARLQHEIGDRRYQCDQVIPLNWGDDSGRQPIVETGQVRFRDFRIDNGESGGNRILSFRVIPRRAALPHNAADFALEYRKARGGLAASVLNGGSVRSGEVNRLTWRACSTNRAPIGRPPTSAAVFIEFEDVPP
ncbi:MAG TPA: hypothetical protein VLM18_01680 [Croceibacterium sp.]|nr:hypothetical protein [Croceibacterium sp.]